jgi:signal peptidase I
MVDKQVWVDSGSLIETLEDEESVDEVEVLESPTDNHSTKKKRPLAVRVLRGAGEILFYFLIAIIVVGLVRIFLLQNFIVPSGSMEETLQIDDMILAWKPGQPHRGDIVVFRDDLQWLAPKFRGDPPADPLETLNTWEKFLTKVKLRPPPNEQYLVKRVIGLEGDTVECCDPQGRIMVNEYPLDESYILYDNAQVALRPFSVVVPEGRMFVLGDHRDNSKDSRAVLCSTNLDDPLPYATPEVDSIQGRVFLILRPLAHFRAFSAQEAFGEVPEPTSDPPTLTTAPWECPE